MVKVHKLISVLLITALFFCIIVYASADVTLPEGAVKGLPEKLTAMDSTGRSVNSETGEYFFIVEGMTFGEVYTKEIQLMNLCDDKSYNIFFYVEPLPESKHGEIDLDQGCVCSFYLDDVQFYNGSVNGIGNIDLTTKVYDLGYYDPGDSHTLSCSIAWVDTTNDLFIDEGHRLIDKTGEWVLTPPKGERHIDGEIEFKWVFSAAVNPDYVPPNTGLLSVNGSFWLCIIAVVAALIIIMSILLVIKKNGKRKTKT